MKKFFWLVVIVLLVLTFSDHESIKPYRDKVYDLIVDKVAIAGDNQEAALRKTRKQLLQLAEQWGDSQQQYLQKHAASLDSLQKFRRSYCINNDFNPILFGEPLRQSCEVIEQNYDNLTRP
ncbi:hypothetical protein MN202_08210 [Rheinheimera muenzenbergensis]|uniref:DUF4363 family protein n=1 Tax=Rheinheimera muenzenbergensis TaxID=1193628 RepID=A0ABU8C6T1_9GAMM